MSILLIRDRSGGVIDEVDFDDLYLDLGHYTVKYVSHSDYQYFQDIRRTLKTSLYGLNALHVSGNYHTSARGGLMDEPDDYNNNQGFFSYEHQKRMHEILLSAVMHALD